ncbi:hypothetical protein C3K47_03135 [Solitalea longa]|uniref:Lipoprotein n=1 Tax=Solitalea longa TaxID=2079460 RepID=A0A2S5A745_9SPHI|nr:hypothetical protein [Solitalea longa]POY38408.1 hypothetical protein C3K47_03135 [Solitalea longa]
MKRNTALSVMAFVFIIACNSKTNKTTVQTDSVSTSDSPKSNEYCYSFIKDKDSVLLRFKMSDDSLILGTLNYNFYEKDSNKGNVQGMLKGDTLLLDYIFQSEGIESVREVAFLKKGDDFVEGYGETVEKDGRLMFKDHKSLNFNSKVELKPSECK